MTISVEETQAIEMYGTYFNQAVMIPYPTRDEFLHADIEELCDDIFTTVNERLGVYSESFDGVTTGQVLQTIREMFAEKLVAATNDGVSDEESTQLVKPVLESVFPTESAIDDAPDIVYERPVITHLTRVLLQTVFDQLGRNAVGENRTNMTVENPLAITEGKWDEVNIQQETNDVTFKFFNTISLIITGDVFVEDIFIPTPKMRYMYEHSAAKAASKLLNVVVSEYSVDTPGFRPVNTGEFSKFVKQKSKQIFTVNCTGSDNEAPKVVTNEIEAVMSDSTDYRTLPDTINDRETLMHITRMILQSVFDRLGNNKTHMSVDDPFAVFTHKWDKIPIERPTPSE